MYSKGSQKLIKMNLLFYLLRLIKIKVNPVMTSLPRYNVGCFYTNNGLNVFTETINTTQCETIDSDSDSLVCYLGGTTNFIDSDKMTIEKCLEICITTYGFSFAGLNV
jgi:hypothetical protein